MVLEDGALRITAIEVNHPPLAKAADGADVLVSEAIAKPVTRALETAARAT